jgi:hypothetical protein
VAERKRFIGGSEFNWLWRATWPLAELLIDDEGVAVRAAVWPLRWVVPSTRLAFGEIAHVEVGAAGGSSFRFRTNEPSWGDSVIFRASSGDRQAIIERLVSAGLDVRDRNGVKLS